MAAKKEPGAKKPKVSIAQYLKSKDARAKQKLKLHFPWAVRILLGLPLLILVFLLLYFVFKVRFLSEY